MKLQNIFRLQKLYYLFFIRQVLSVGVLKEKFFQIVIGFVCLGVTIGTTMFFYNIFDDSNISYDLDLMRFLVQMQGINTFIWTIIIFVFLKILFLKKGSFLNMTTQLPITNQERNISLLWFELIMAMVVTGIVSFSYALAIMLRSGLTYAPLLVSSIIFTALINYLILQLLYVFITYILSLLKLEKLKSMAVLLIFMGVLYFLYQDVMATLIGDGSVALEDLMSRRHWSQFFIFIHEQYNFLLSLAVFSFCFIILTSITLMTPNKMYAEESLYINIKLPFTGRFNLVNLYTLQHFRRIENYATIILVYCVFIFLSLSSSMNPLYALFLNVTLGLYSYAQTDPIRLLSFKLDYCAFKDYVGLILSQVAYLIVIAIPLILVQFITDSPQLMISELAPLSLSLTFAVILSTCIGILFPATKENPFSPFMGVLIIAIITLAMTLILQFLNLSVLSRQLVLLAIHLFVGYMSYLGLVKLKEDAIYAKD